MSWEFEFSKLVWRGNAKLYMGLSSPPFGIDGIRNIGIFRNFAYMKDQSMTTE
jgi:hypothetical protein